MLVGHRHRRETTRGVRPRRAAARRESRRAQNVVTRRAGGIMRGRGRRRRERDRSEDALDDGEGRRGDL